MFSDPAPPTTSAPSPPTSPSRFGRGLSYLRNYTHHLHTRSDSDQPAPAATAVANVPDPPSQVPTASALHPSDSTPQPPVPATNNTALPTASRSGGWIPSQQGPISALIAAASGRAQVASDPSPLTLQTSETMTRNPSSTSDRPAGPVSNIQPPPAQAIPPNQQLPSIRFIPHHDPRTHRPSLTFQAISRTLPTAEAIIRVGRYSERDGSTEIKGNIPSAAPVGFKSKVVSRRHCEFWCENSQWYIRDVKSSSGTFLNHLRLSPPGVESKAYPVNDGDVVQLGIDFRGGEEMIFRCVKIRIECNRGWQKGLNPFNKSTHKRLKKLADTKTKKRDSDTQSLSSTDCTICLMSISPCQSLFVAPCSHVWHYKCIRPILNGPTYPNLTCPNCRAAHDLQADIEEAESEWDDEVELQQAIEASKQDNDTSAATIPITATPTRSRPSLDADGDSPMPDHLPETSAPVPQRPPPAPPVENQSESIPINQILEQRLQSDAGASSATPPRNIPPRTNSNSRFELSPAVNGVVSDGPMTPRNDAGPFVLDGSAGRATTSAVAPVTVGNRPRAPSHISLSHEDVDT